MLIGAQKVNSLLRKRRCHGEPKIFKGFGFRVLGLGVRVWGFRV